MKRIIIHWTGGAFQPNELEYEHYHYLINVHGLIIQGKHPVSDNLDCTDGNYAAHTGGGNTGSIGVAFCGMLGWTKDNPQATSYPLNRPQFEHGLCFIAELAQKYNIPITPQTVLTHYEFGQQHPDTMSHNKPDITYLSFDPTIRADLVGDYIRRKVNWYRINHK